MGPPQASHVSSGILPVQCTLFLSGCLKNGRTLEILERSMFSSQKITCLVFSNLQCSYVLSRVIPVSSTMHITTSQAHVYLRSLTMTPSLFMQHILRSVKFACAEGWRKDVQAEVPKLLDGLIWRSRLTENGWSEGFPIRIFGSCEWWSGDLIKCRELLGG